MDHTLLKTTDGRTEELVSFIQKNRAIIEGAPFNYCTIPNTITFKQDMAWQPIYSNHEIKAGDTYLWAVSYHETANWIPHFLRDSYFDVQEFEYVDVPDYWLAGYEDYLGHLPIGSKIGEFENNFVIIKPIVYKEENAC